MKTIPVRKINRPDAGEHPPRNFSIRSLKEMLLHGDMNQPLHRHDFVFVLALQKGAGDHIIDFRPYPASDRSVFFVRPGQVHQLMLKQGSTGYLMAFGADFYAARSTELKQVYRRASQKTHCQLDAAGFEHLYACLTDIFREYTQREDRYLPAIEALLDVFLIRYVRPAKSLDGQDDHAAPYALERLDAFLELLDRHIGTQKQASDYARMLHLSLYQLNAITKSALGKTCSDLITERIILEAKRLLLVTTDQVSLVADQLGYDDVSYFIRFFKKKTGHSPERFRKNFK